MVEARDIIAEYLLLRDEMAPNPDDKDDAERSQSADGILDALTSAGWTLAPPGSHVVPEAAEAEAARLREVLANIQDRENAKGETIPPMYREWIDDVLGNRGWNAPPLGGDHD